MPKEKETYRLELEEIYKRFPGKGILTVKDVAAYTGHSRNWCRLHLDIKGETGVTAVGLAHRLSEIG